LNIRFLCQ